MCRSEPIEVLYHVRDQQPAYWLWSKAFLCPPCKAAQEDLWRPGLVAAQDLE